MLAKVGSAGYIIDSVIQYPQGGGKSTSDRKGEDKKSAAKRNTQVVSGYGKDNSAIKKPASDHEKTVREKPLKTIASIGPGVADSVIEMPQNPELNEKYVRLAVDEINDKLEPIGTSIEFKYHKETRRYSFKILDYEGNIIKEVPPEKSLDMLAKMYELMGILVDDKF